MYVEGINAFQIRTKLSKSFKLFKKAKYLRSSHDRIN